MGIPSKAKLSATVTGWGYAYHIVLVSKRAPTYPWSISHPQTPRWKEFLRKLLVEGFGVFQGYVGNFLVLVMFFVFYDFEINMSRLQDIERLHCLSIPMMSPEMMMMMMMVGCWQVTPLARICCTHLFNDNSSFAPSLGDE